MKIKGRRQFLKNTAIAAISSAIIPSTLRSASSNNDQDTCNTTTLDLYGQGPFYSENPPELSDNLLASITESGNRLIISGRIYNEDCTEFLPNTKIDIWHANDEGAYDNTGYNLRGVVYSNSQGFYIFETIKPGKYLNGASYRPSHIHFKITPPGFGEFITQLYFEGDTDIPGDAAASITSGTYDASNRIIPLDLASDGLHGTWDISVIGDGTALGVSDIHLDKGVIYSANPNPFSNTINIRYGIFAEAIVSLLVFDVNGKQVALLEEQKMQAEQYDAQWTPDDSLPNGHYFIALKINDLQVHYLKVVYNK